MALRGLKKVMNKEQKHLLLEIAKNVMMFDCKQKKDIGDLLQK